MFEIFAGTVLVLTTLLLVLGNRDSAAIVMASPSDDVGEANLSARVAIAIIASATDQHPCPFMVLPSILP